MSNWISVYDALPLTTKENTMSSIVLGTTGPNVIGLFRHYLGKWQYCPTIKDWPEPKVTHWMPLPNTPHDIDA